MIDWPHYSKSVGKKPIMVGLHDTANCLSHVWEA